MSHTIQMEGSKKITIKGVKRVESYNHQITILEVSGDDYKFIKVIGYGLKLEDFDSEDGMVYVSGCIVAIEHVKQLK